MPDSGGGGGGFDFGGLFNPLLGFLAALIQAIIDFLNALVSALVQVLNFLYEGELGIFGFSNKGLEHVFKGFKNLMDQIFKVWVTKSLHHLLDLYQKLQAFLKKLKVWLDRMRKLQALYQVRAMRRFINLIQRIRKVLVLFRILHLKFATKLDNWLAGIEGKLVRRTAELAAKTNEIIAWINLVADPSTLFRQVPLLRSMGRGLHDMFTALEELGLKNYIPQLEQGIGTGGPSRPWSDVVAQFHSEVKSDSGDYGGFKRQSADFRTLFDQGFRTGK